MNTNWEKDGAPMASGQAAGTTRPTNLQPDTVMASGAGRMSGKEVIRQEIGRLRNRANDLETVLDMLPSNPTPQQDEALWKFAVESLRR
jgi:hypothetical protein